VSVQTQPNAWYVPRTDISPDPFNPRRSMSDLQDLADSIKAYGIIQPIVIRPTTPDDTEAGIETPWIIVAGERRWRAAGLANIGDVPCVVPAEVSIGEKRRTPSSAERSSIGVADTVELALVENTQRVDLSPVETAHAFKSILTREGVSMTVLAKRIGKSPEYVRQRLILLDLPEQVQRYLSEGSLPVIAGIHLAALIGKVTTTEIVEVAGDIITKRLSGEAVKKKVAAMLRPDEEPPTKGGMAPPATAKASTPPAPSQPPTPPSVAPHPVVQSLVPPAAQTLTWGTLKFPEYENVVESTILSRPTGDQKGFVVCFVTANKELASQVRDAIKEVRSKKKDGLA